MSDKRSAFEVRVGCPLHAHHLQGRSKILLVYFCPRLFMTTSVDFRVRELPLGYFCTVTPP